MDDDELKEPVDCHVDGIADATDTGRQDLGAVKVLDRAETDGPAHGIDEDGGDGGSRSSWVVVAAPQSHIDGHVDVCDALNDQSGHEASAAAKVVYESPHEDHGEDELRGSVASGADEGAIARDAGVPEYFGDVVGDAIATAPLDKCLHGEANEETAAAGRHCGHLLDDEPYGRVGEDKIFCSQLLLASLEIRAG